MTCPGHSNYAQGRRRASGDGVRVISTRASDSSVISTRGRELLPREGKGTREIGVLSKNSELFPRGGWVDDGARYFPGRVSGGSRYFAGVDRRFSTRKGGEGHRTNSVGAEYLAFVGRRGRGFQHMKALFHDLGDRSDVKWARAAYFVLRSNALQIKFAGREASRARNLQAPDTRELLEP